MTDVLRIAHPQNCPPYGNSRVGICEGNRKSFAILKPVGFPEKVFHKAFAANLDSGLKASRV